MRSNFTFLQTEWPELFGHATEAEKHTFTAPRTSAFYSRLSLETIVRWMYDNDRSLRRPYDTSLNSLLHEQTFRDAIPPGVFQELRLIQQTGNRAAHAQAPTDQEALAALKRLFSFLSLTASLYSQSRPAIPRFDETLIPTTGAAGKTLEELKSLQEEYDASVEALQKQKDLLRESEAERQRLQHLLDEVQARKEKNQAVVPAIEKPYTEAETRRLFIDLLLKEAGWNPAGPNVREYEVTGMPQSVNPSGKGYADYVLWGDNGKPLAVVEAKKTLLDPRQGAHQAKLYADCLAQMTGQRPLIFYTNGYETYLWDDTAYPPRQVQGFYTKDELQWVVNRRAARKSLRMQAVNKAIADRYYQEESIRRLTEAFEAGKREGLLVMATGSGKTRTAAALVDLLMKAGWVRRVLFLADRTALVKQAKNSFAQHLPHLSGVDLTREREDQTSRMVFSTYPTMMNCIDGLRSGDNRFYSAGHFDLIIIDEAHRSVYLKYKAIFTYFDCLLIGLTATPKAEVDKNTYELFELEDHIPTYAYELNQAVADGYLVPPKAISVPLKFHREGIRYRDLKESEKEDYEMTFRDEESGGLPQEIGAAALNEWLFNQDTVDKVLAYLMESGLKVEGGDKLGKTIIFARSHKHALFIKERFDKMYPRYAGHFLDVIDNFADKAQDLLDNFAQRDKYPQIAVSVDMLDTGIDVPEVVNLVFFKPVKSKAKYWQMIGRGTRLCPDLFGPGRHKEYFCIFDFCENFEFFENFPEGIQPSGQESVTQKTFKARLRLAEALRADAYADVAHQSLRKDLLDRLHAAIRNLSDESFHVRQAWRLVHAYQVRDRWENLRRVDVLDIEEKLSPLPLAEGDDEPARRFDLLVLNLQLSLVEGGKAQEGYVARITEMAEALSRKGNIPAVAGKKDLIGQVQQAGFWKEASLPALETVRAELRELVKFLDRQAQEPVYTRFEDVLYLSQVQEKEIIPIGSELPGYRRRVEKFLREHQHHLTISRLRSNQPITSAELEELERLMFNGGELGTKEDFQRVYGEDKPLTFFIRSIMGLDANAAKEAFSEFLSAGNLSADQITFINKIIDHLTVNGTIESSMLFEPPFTDIHHQGVLGVFAERQLINLKTILDTINRNAMPA